MLRKLWIIWILLLLKELDMMIISHLNKALSFHFCNFNRILVLFIIHYLFTSVRRQSMLLIYFYAPRMV